MPAGYFDFIPPLRPQEPLFDEVMGSSKVHCSNAFHEDSSATPFEYPENAHLYAKRALPPLPPPQRMPPPVPRKPVGSAPRTPTRPSPTRTHRSHDYNYQSKPSPQVPSREKSPSFETLRPLQSSDNTASPQRPRTHRNISFRTFLGKTAHQFPSPPSSDKHESMMSNASTASTMTSFNSSDSTSSRHDSVFDEPTLKLSKTSTNASSTTMRRPSALHLNQLRKASNGVDKENRPPRSRKNSTSSSISPMRRRGFFGGSFSSTYGDEEIPPSPTPPMTPTVAQGTELSCRPCYYFTARGCGGYVFAGAHGQACESCNSLGFFGAP